jgi:DNA-binding XRE family transcriptional regulator
MKLQDAIVELRRIAEKSQQVMATELGVATKSLQLWESGRRLPEPGKLLWLMAYADQHAFEREDIYTAFTATLTAQLTPPPGYEVEISYKRSAPPTQRRKK